MVDQDGGQDGNGNRNEGEKMKCENIVKWENGKVGSKERYRVKYRL